MTLEDADNRFSTDKLCAHLAARIEAASVETNPYAHFIVDDALPIDFYVAFAGSIPHRDAFACLTDGEDRDTAHTLMLSYAGYTGRSPAHKSVFDKIRKAFAFASAHIAAKLTPHIKVAFSDIFGENYQQHLDFGTIEHLPVANLYERRSWFEQPPHLDGCFRLGSWLFYIPLGSDTVFPGTDIYRTTGRNAAFDPLATMFLRTPRGLDLELAGTVSYRANRIFAFVNSPFSFHGVTRDEERGEQGRRISMLNWIELSKAATERIYGRALFIDPPSYAGDAKRRFEILADLPLNQPRLAADIKICGDGRVVTRRNMWSYAAWYPFEPPFGTMSGSWVIRVRLCVYEGAIGVGVQPANSDDFVHETQVSAAINPVSVDIRLSDLNCSYRLMFRNVSEHGASAFTVEAISIGIAR